MSRGICFPAVIYSMSRVADRVSQVFLIVLMSLVVANIMGRLLKHPIIGTYELAGVLGALLVSSALAYCAVQKGNIAVTLVVDRLPQRTRATIDSIIGIISLILFGLVSWECAVWGTKVMTYGEVLSATRIFTFPFIYATGLGCFLLCLVLLTDLYKSLTGVFRK